VGAAESAVFQVLVFRATLLLRGIECVLTADRDWLSMGESHGSTRVDFRTAAMIQLVSSKGHEVTALTDVTGTFRQCLPER
jgi:hypothetical protein